jgi:hypothetical protein
MRAVLAGAGVVASPMGDGRSQASVTSPHEELAGMGEGSSEPTPPFERAETVDGEAGW